MIITLRLRIYFDFSKFHAGAPRWLPSSPVEGQTRQRGISGFREFLIATLLRQPPAPAHAHTEGAQLSVDTLSMCSKVNTSVMGKQQGVHSFSFIRFKPSSAAAFTRSVTQINMYCMCREEKRNKYPTALWCVYVCIPECLCVLVIPPMAD